MSAISAFQVERAMSAAQSFAADLLASDPEMDHDSLVLALDSETDVMEVLRRVVRASLEARALADATGERMSALAERKGRFLARMEAARGLALAMMEALELPKIEDAEFTVSVNKPKPKAIVTNLDALPEACVRVTRSADMATINAMVKAGQPPAGVEMSNGAPSITVRVR